MNGACLSVYPSIPVIRVLPRPLVYLHTDHLGSTTLVTDESGAEVGRAAYDPYGNLIENTIPLTLTERLFTGQVWEVGLGLYNYRARFYDPMTGSFIQPDSLALTPALSHPQ
jgi:RHS repeat-associated protein